MVLRREDFGVGFKRNALGQIELDLDPNSILHADVKTNRIGAVLHDGLTTTPGSPRGAAVYFDDKSIQQDRKGALIARPDAEHVRDTSSLGAKTIKAALDLLDSRFRGSQAAGTTFPKAFDGRQFYRTDLGEVFFYSGSRASWVSQAKDVYEGETAAIAVSGYLMFPGLSLIFTSANGYSIPYTSLLTELHVFKNDAVNNPTFQVRSGGSSITSLQVGAGNKYGRNLGLNVSVAADAVLGFYCDVGIGALAGNARVRAVFRRTTT